MKGDEDDDNNSNDENIEDHDGVVVKDVSGYTGLYTGACYKEDHGEKKGKLLPHGQGVIQYHSHPTINFYSGTWNKGTWVGEGMTSMKSGDVYVGEHLRQKRHGKGRYSSLDGAVYEGNFKNGVEEGHGKFSCNTQTYEGEFKGGKYHGHGVLKCKLAENIETFYKGFFENGKPHGTGIEYNPDGTIRHDGLWEHGQPANNEKSKSDKSKSKGRSRSRSTSRGENNRVKHTTRSRSKGESKDKIRTRSQSRGRSNESKSKSRSRGQSASRSRSESESKSKTSKNESRSKSRNIDGSLHNSATSNKSALGDFLDGMMEDISARSPSGERKKVTKSPLSPSRSPSAERRKVTRSPQSPSRSPSAERRKVTRTPQSPSRSPSAERRKVARTPQSPSRSPSAERRKVARTPQSPSRSPSAERRHRARTPTSDDNSSKSDINGKTGAFSLTESNNNRVRKPRRTRSADRRPKERSPRVKRPARRAQSLDSKQKQTRRKLPNNSPIIQSKNTPRMIDSPTKVASPRKKREKFRASRKEWEAPCFEGLSSSLNLVQMTTNPYLDGSSHSAPSSYDSDRSASRASSRSVSRASSRSVSRASSRSVSRASSRSVSRASSRSVSITSSMSGSPSREPSVSKEKPAGGNDESRGRSLDNIRSGHKKRRNKDKSHAAKNADISKETTDSVRKRGRSKTKRTISSYPKDDKPREESNPNKETEKKTNAISNLLDKTDALQKDLKKTAGKIMWNYRSNRFETLEDSGSLDFEIIT